MAVNLRYPAEFQAAAFGFTPVRGAKRPLLRDPERHHDAAPQRDRACHVRGPSSAASATATWWRTASRSRTPPAPAAACAPTSAWAPSSSPDPIAGETASSCAGPARPRVRVARAQADVPAGPPILAVRPGVIELIVAESVIHHRGASLSTQTLICHGPPSEPIYGFGDSGSVARYRRTLVRYTAGPSPARQLLADGSGRPAAYAPTSGRNRVTAGESPPASASRP